MEKSLFEELGVTYVQDGNHLRPDLELPPRPEKPTGKYGRMRLKFLKEHRSAMYNYLLLTLELDNHLVEINEAAHNRLDELMPKLAEEAGATLQLRREDPMKWVGLMNNCKAQAEEIICQALIYV